MTVSSLVPVNSYAGNSYSKKFDFDFLIESGSELIVQHTDENGIATILKEGIDYSINEIGNKEGSYITFPLETSSYGILKENEKITLMLTLVIKQESEFRNSSYFNFNILEWTFDYIVRILQIISRQIERCVKVREGDNISPDDLVNDVKKSEINAQNWYEKAKKCAENALEYFQLSKAWAVKTDTKVQEEDFSSKYYAMDAKKSASLAASYVFLHYIPFCVNRGNVENGHPALLKLEGNILKTQGVFDATTAQGKFYSSLSDFSLDITNFPNGLYNIFIDPLEKVMTLKSNNVYLGNEFPSSAIDGDYLFNISSTPYDLEEKTQDGSKKGIGLILAGTINILDNTKEIVVNPYNKNLENFNLEQSILNNKVVRMFDLITKDHILSYEEKEGFELLGEYVYKEGVLGSRYGYPDFYNKCLKEYNEAEENQEEIEGTIIKIHSNGHKFYDIKDKEKIDEIYSQTGIAWYYGIDTENQRILLPRISNILLLSLVKNEKIYNIYMVVGNTSVTRAQTDVVQVTTSENDTLPLFTGLYFDFKPNHLSWLKAGTQVSGRTYTSAYNELIKCINSIDNKYDLKVIKTSDMLPDTDYSEYWTVNENNETFRTPLKTSLLNTISNARILIEKKEPTDEDTFWYNLYSDGWLEQGGIADTINGTVTVTLPKMYKNVSSYEVFQNFQGPTSTTSVWLASVSAINKTEYSFQIKEGAVYNKQWIAFGYTNPPSAQEIANNENMGLYFKVANAVENLELIDAGKVLENLNLKISKTEDVVKYIMPKDLDAKSWTYLSWNTEYIFNFPIFIWFGGYSQTVNDDLILNISGKDLIAHDTGYMATTLIVPANCPFKATGGNGYYVLAYMKIGE